MRKLKLIAAVIDRILKFLLSSIFITLMVGLGWVLIDILPSSFDYTLFAIICLFGITLLVSIIFSMYIDYQKSKIKKVVDGIADVHNMVRDLKNVVDKNTDAK